MATTTPLSQLQAGMQLVVGGNRLVTVDAELAARFGPGDSLAVVERTGEVLHIPAAEADVANRAVERTHRAFAAMSQVTDGQITSFFLNFAERLADEATWAQIVRANIDDLNDAKARGRSTTRLEATEAMRQGMISGLRVWAELGSVRGRVLEVVDHGTWKAELVGAELGVVAFVFEGRPNVVADATGVLRGGNTVVFRIGRDALGTARAILRLATTPALVAAGLPQDAVTVVDSASHAAGWALFRDSRLSLAVARGSGPAVATLGSLAQSAGVPVSLHGTGGAWLVVDADTTAEQLSQNVFDSLDRKVCNTMNTCCILRSQATRLVPAFLEGLQRAALRRQSPFKLHVTQCDVGLVPSELFSRTVAVGRAEGPTNEAQAQAIGVESLGREWEWEDSPEVTLTFVDSLEQAAQLFNRYSPQFVACLLSQRPEAQAAFFAQVNAPFVGDGFTRWVDGQYALSRPELGLSNWENGRLFGRGGVLSGDSVFTVRTRVSGTASGKPRS